jgi:Uma2 family endonuclease
LVKEKEDLMSIATVPPAQMPDPMGPRPRRWTKEEYHQMGEFGWFADQRVELLEGEIVEMPVPGSPHCVSTDNVAEVLRGVFPRERYWVRMQMPLNLGLETEPQPDVAVAPGPKSSYKEHPTTASPLVEVSDTTLQVDRGKKAGLYARAGIEDYWIVNLVDRVLEVHRQPVADKTAPLGFRYQEITVLGAADTVTPLAAPQAVIAVADLLP